MSRSFVAFTLLGSGALAAMLVACSGDEGLVPIEGSANPPAATRLAADTGVEWIVEMDPRTNTASFAFPSTPTPPVLLAGQDAAGVASAFLARYPDVFGVAHAADLQSETTEVDDEGATHVRLVLQQGRALHRAEWSRRTAVRKRLNEIRRGRRAARGHPWGLQSRA
jgi:hypothetical protein